MCMYVCMYVCRQTGMHEYVCFSVCMYYVYMYNYAILRLNYPLTVYNGIYRLNQKLMLADQFLQAKLQYKNFNNFTKMSLKVS